MVLLGVEKTKWALERGVEDVVYSTPVAFMDSVVQEFPPGMPQPLSGQNSTVGCYSIKYHPTRTLKSPIPFAWVV